MSSLVLPFTKTARAAHGALDRLVIILLGFGAPMVLLSISYEVLFYLCFTLLLLLWLVIEWHLVAFSEWEPLVEKPGVTSHMRLDTRGQGEAAKGNVATLTPSDVPAASRRGRGASS